MGIYFENLCKDLIVELALQSLGLGIGLKDILLVLHELVSGNALAVDQSLLAVEVIRSL